MKKFFHLSFIFLYLIGMIAPYAPLLEYYTNYTYIKENLCEKREEPESDCCGKCYLKKQIVKEEKKEDKQQTATIKDGKNTDYHFARYFIFPKQFFNRSNQKARSFNITVLTRSQLPETPPPRYTT